MPFQLFLPYRMTNVGGNTTPEDTENATGICFYLIKLTDYIDFHKLRINKNYYKKKNHESIY